jgi:hydroxymethylpyrimidine/phosphomethylpyrimidine kinase
MSLESGGKQSSRERNGLVGLTIAGFDPSSGAGATADLKVFAAHGIYGMAAVTALTVQSTLGVRASRAVDAEVLHQTLVCLREDVNFAGIKIGMLADARLVEVVADFLAGEGEDMRERVVLDPVMRSSSGRSLLDARGVEVLKRRLLRQVGWITPNVDEAAALTRLPVGSREEIAAAAARLQEMAAEAGNGELNVVVTGGHREQPDDFLRTLRGEEYWLAGERVETTSTHGTGCAFSTALVCALMEGYPAYPAVEAAKAYVTAALKTAYPVGRGKGPMNHLYRFER